ncbi:RNA-guided pseudouridylation complex pseudouridine synthase subunit Cbf5 [Candidatus Woesearchaeota archaeon]|nr:MAG: RNA-guided pseudouridylation complex pseudouridine synthase subunit Cbf5 [Candidatus Woesearchaeota archaeon]
MHKLPFELVEREILIKKDAETDPELGCFPYERSVPELLEKGVINLNKPKGPTSHMVADYVKKIFKARKAGHGGSLDPGVTGVLPIGLNRATAVLQALLTAGKEYVAIMHLHDDFPEDKIRAVMRDFVGEITQLPPKKSAVKRVERKRTVYYLDIIEIDGRDVLFRMGCQAGTYVRRLCDDIGKKLGSHSHMAELVRTKAGPFNDADWVSLQDLEDAFALFKEDGDERFLRHCVKPMEFAVSHLPKIWVLDNAVDSLAHGAPLHIPGIAKLHSGIKTGDSVAVMTLKDELVALAVAMMPSAQMLKQDRGLAARSSRVLMETGVYKS